MSCVLVIIKVMQFVFFEHHRMSTFRSDIEMSEDGGNEVC